MKNYESIKFKMAAYRPLFFYTCRYLVNRARWQDHYYKTKCEFSEEDAPWKFSTLIEFKMANNGIIYLDRPDIR